MRGKEMSAADYIDLLAARADLQKRVSAITSNYDAVVMPTCAIVAPTLDEVSTPDGFTKKNMLLLRNTTVGNFLDRCGISLPCHAAGELPVGFSLMGEAMADRRILAMARSVAPVVRGSSHLPSSGGSEAASLEAADLQVRSFLSDWGPRSLAASEAGGCTADY